MLRARHLWQQEVTVNGGKHGLASRCGQRGDGNAPVSRLAGKDAWTAPEMGARARARAYRESHLGVVWHRCVASDAR